MATLSDFRPGVYVRCEREAPAKGTWHRWAGRVAKVMTANRIDGEVGVTFNLDAQPNRAGGTSGLTWFLPTELVVLSERPAKGPRDTP